MERDAEGLLKGRGSTLGAVESGKVVGHHRHLIGHAGRRRDMLVVGRGAGADVGGGVGRRVASLDNHDGYGS